MADLGAAFAALLDSPASGAVNVASGETTSIRALVSLIAGIMGKESLLRIGALPTRAGDPPVLTAATRKLREEIGWRPSLSLEAGLRQTIDT